MLILQNFGKINNKNPAKMENRVFFFFFFFFFFCGLKLELYSKTFFKNFQLKFLDIGQKCWFYKILEKLTKKPC